MCRTKAQMLAFLRKNLPKVNILPLYTVSANEYFSDKNACISGIMKKFGKITKSVIVRSSCRNEDKAEASNAGKYISVPGVNINSMDEIGNAIERVYRSYNTVDTTEEILIQPFLGSTLKSGVVFTADMETFAPYYTINYYEGTNTEAVTSGGSSNLTSFICYKDAIDRIKDEDIKNVLLQCREIEEFLGNNAIDIEFCVTQSHEIVVFQVRPITMGNKVVYEKLDLSESLLRIYKKVEKLNQRHPFLLGNQTHFGVMPDWNPAEILGMRPKRLAVSLYKELITDYIWAKQRKEYGYRDLTMHPLMVSFCGLPYIDTRITFNSFIPAELGTNIAEKLVNYYLDVLRRVPAYHDKIEFEIVYSCYYFGIADELKKLLNNGFNDNEIKRIEFSLLNLTNNVINPEKGLYKQDLAKIGELENKRCVILNSDISVVDKIYWLIEECKEYGTLPFAGVARAAFIAVQFLNSLVREKIITPELKSKFLHSLHLVTDKMNEDFEAYSSGTMGKDTFLSLYGHIRPGTYDIMSERYDEAFEKYFSKNNRKVTQKASENNGCVFPDEIIRKMDNELIENGLKLSAKQLLQFIKEAIEGREHLKFVFTKCVSDVLKLLSEYGERLDIQKKDLAHLDIAIVKRLYVDLCPWDVKNIFMQNINYNKEKYAYERQIRLPALIVDPDSVYSFFQLKDEPNYITQKHIVGTPILHNGHSDCLVSGKIVFIQAADPGYDYLFSKDIVGLVTQYGGANSHMAIRCAELGIPAVIGSGEENFILWSQAENLDIDCQGKKVICL